VIEVRVAALTVRGAEPITPPKLARMFVAPCIIACARPAAEIVATPVLLDDQETSRFSGWMVESLNVPVATNPIAVVGAMVRPVGVTEMDWINAFVTLSVTDALTKPGRSLAVEQRLRCK
jgi:hypothetical protein